MLLLSLFRLKHIVYVIFYVLILCGAIGGSWGLSEKSIFLPFRILVYLNALGSVVFFYNSSIFQSKYTAESLFLLLASTLGLNMMMLSEDLLSLFVALELAAISSYILVVLSWKKHSLEGAMKYLLFGVFSSVLMLYGISWLYGLSGSIELLSISWNFPVGYLHHIAIFLMLAGFLMKISAAPYHIWTPDVYQIAPTPIVAFLATASKIAGTIALFKITKAYAPILPNIMQMIAFIAIISIIWGNLLAFWQQNLKRMLAYSSVANAGYLLIGAINPNYQDTLFFFLLVYSVANMLILVMAEYYEQNHQYTDLEHFSGMSKVSPLMSISVLVGFVSLAGLPPTAGFTAKLLILSGLWESFQFNKQSIFLLWLVVGAFGSVLSLFYYLKIPYFAFFKSLNHSTKPTTVATATLLFASVLAFLLIFFFIDFF